MVLIYSGFPRESGPPDASTSRASLTIRKELSSMRAIKHHTSVSYSALAAIVAALLIGVTPVATLVALNAKMEAVK
jgi:hypothetical protein